ncbi:unnamed protein product [Phytophthora fragariaefolia]|uniref:Unnamed protein product n=1 Tax=Phytophthora fragariaefolia TaxID=1490495 RepID=A0A9W6XPF3_9STRA|nr:unnamed protein product [Phytophthora fragariaefolia]
MPFPAFDINARQDSEAACARITKDTIIDLGGGDTLVHSLFYRAKSSVMASKGNEKEIDYVSKQANITAQIESELQAAKKWWDEYGMCYLENARPEDFTYDNRVLALKKKLEHPK